MLTPFRWQELTTRRDRLKAIAIRMSELEMDDAQAAAAWRNLAELMYRWDDPFASLRTPKFNDLLLDILRAGVKAKSNAKRESSKSSR